MGGSKRKSQTKGLGIAPDNDVLIPALPGTGRVSLHLGF
jgi:hypothetical protein